MTDRVSDERPPFIFKAYLVSKGMADAGCRYVKFVIDRSLERKQRKHEIYGALNFVNPVLPVSPDAGTDIMDVAM